MRKKLFALALATTAVLTFAACGSNGNTSKDASTPPSSSSAPSSAAASTPSSSAEVPSSSAETASASLEDWAKSDDCKQLENMTNLALTGQGMTVKFSADGNILVVEYILDDYLDVSGISQAEIDEAFTGLADSMSSVFAGFEHDYGITLDGLRAVAVNADGTELYSEELENK